MHRFMRFFAVMGIGVLSSAGVNAQPAGGIDNAFQLWGKDDYEGAIAILKRPEFANDPRGQYLLGDSYLSTEGPSANKASGDALVRSALARLRANRVHDPLSAFLIGYAAYFEVGTTKNLIEAGRELETCLDQMPADCGLVLGLIENEYVRGDAKDRPGDVRKRNDYLMRAANAGDPSAARLLGTFYYFGSGIAVDRATAANLRAKAGEGGNVDAAMEAALQYDNGDGVTADKAKAARLYDVAAKGGNAAAMNNLAFLYKEGKGVARDYQLAMALYLKAAEKGNDAAMNNIGVMYEEGLGVRQDYAVAQSWYRRSLAAGNSRAQASLDKVQRKIKMENEKSQQNAAAIALVANTLKSQAAPQRPANQSPPKPASGSNGGTARGADEPMHPDGNPCVLYDRIADTQDSTGGTYNIKLTNRCGQQIFARWQWSDRFPEGVNVQGTYLDGGKSYVTTCRPSSTQCTGRFRSFSSRLVKVR